MTTEVLPNGVDATAVVAYAQRLQTDAPAEGTPFSSTVIWQGGFRNEIVVRDLPPTYADSRSRSVAPTPRRTRSSRSWAPSAAASPSATPRALWHAASPSTTSAST